jgi:2-polyprenyl-6-methoxyphenol hydroxylase-like FAD-dependent oxidoreductase
MNANSAGVDVTLADASTGRYDIVIGADGVFSQTRAGILPEAPKRTYAGQWVWRYNLPMPAVMDGIQIFAGPCNGGLVPMADGLMYMFLLSAQEEGFVLPTAWAAGAADAMRNCVRIAPPQLASLLAQITEDEGVVARPLEIIFVQGDWHKGRVVLIDDAIHASTPHLAQCAGMAIKDGIVLAEELANGSTPQEAFTPFRNRRFARVKHVAENSVRLGDMQMGKVEPFDVGALTGQTIAMMVQPI